MGYENLLKQTIGNPRGRAREASAEFLAPEGNSGSRQSTSYLSVNEAGFLLSKISRIEKRIKELEGGEASAEVPKLLSPYSINLN